MTHSALLTLHGVSYQFPDGRSLFSGLDTSFDHRPTGLVGRNGVGKSVLARIMAGELTPSAGHVLRSGTAFYLAQQISPAPLQTVAALAGVQAQIDAMQRIECGSTLQRDFDVLGERWDIRDRLAQALDEIGLAGLRPDTPAAQLSGGEITRVALAGALLSEADLLILDEPSNHLDGAGRRALLDRLQRRTGGLIVVSHDRELLDSMHVIVELTAAGLRRYGGGYDFYARAREQERAAAQQQLDHRKAERRREERALDRQRERSERRLARGRRDAADANLPPILLGLRKRRSESSAGKLRAQQDAAREVLSQRVREAAAQVEPDCEIVLFSPQSDAPTPQRVVELDGVVLPHLDGALRRIDLSLMRGQRVALIGPNGSGKSTLLQVMSGRLAPLGGRCEVRVETACLDQHLSLLDPHAGVLDQLLAVNRASDEGVLRSRLALLGLDAQHLTRPVGSLSGGERVRAAMARALYADRPAQLLLLDEPDNHLDLASTAALEAMLRQYTGTLVAVSHDARFLDALKPTHRLQPTPAGWRMAPLRFDA